MKRCEICGKPTTSHKIDDYYVCHTCWSEDPEKVDELKEQTKKEEEEKEKTEDTIEGLKNLIKKRKEEVEEEKTEEEMKEELKKAMEKRKQEEEEFAERSGGKDTAERISNKLEDVDSKKELYSVFEEYQKEMKDSLKKSPKGRLFRYLEGKLCKKISDILFEFSQEEGWPFVMELIETYGLEREGVIDSVPIEEVVSRMILLTRTEEGVENIPVKALDYLATFCDAPDMEWEMSFSLGWGFDHPEFDFEDLIEEKIQMNEGIWASGVLERAFYADQRKAAPILIEFLKRDDISHKDKMTLIQAITFFTDEGWPRMETSPRYWDWKEEIGYESFEWDEEVERSLKEVIEEELADYIEREQSKDLDMMAKSQKAIPVHECDFSEDWSFIDLQL